MGQDPGARTQNQVSFVYSQKVLDGKSFCLASDVFMEANIRNKFYNVFFYPIPNPFQQSSDNRLALEDWKLHVDNIQTEPVTRTRVDRIC